MAGIKLVFRVPLLVFCMHAACAANAFGAADARQTEEPDPRTRTLVAPARVLAVSPAGKKSSVADAGALLEPKRGQVTERRWTGARACVMKNSGETPWVLLDFGRELHGGLQIHSYSQRGAKVRVRFGESAGEAMSDIGAKGASNDHAPRDIVLELSHMGQIEYGNTGFRFVRIDLVSQGKCTLDCVRAVSLMRKMDRIGSFKSSDARLDAIWETAVRTVHLCSQEYLWDGAKRDRLVWAGDMHPEASVILAVFGEADVLKRTIDYIMEITPPDKWMNAIDTYTMWFLRIVRDWYMFTGDESFVRERGDYLARTVEHLLACEKRGRYAGSSMPGFLDWPTHRDRAAESAGAQGLRASGFDAAALLMDVAGKGDLAARCRKAAAKIRAAGADPHGAKSAAALLALGGVRDAKEMYAKVLGRGGLAGVSTFYGYYMIEAMSAAGENAHALDTVRDYWGGMLDMGATSFWEDFNPAWTNGAARIDEMPKPGMKDVHGDFGDFCYKGFRHSLCHGWSAGPAAWCLNHILGIRPLDAGMKTIEVKPFLGDLEWAEGSMALPGGKAIRVSAKKRPDGRIAVEVSAPPDVKVLYSGVQ